MVSWLFGASNMTGDSWPAIKEEPAADEVGNSILLQENNQDE